MALSDRFVLDKLMSKSTQGPPRCSMQRGGAGDHHCSCPTPISYVTVDELTLFQLLSLSFTQEMLRIKEANGMRT